MICSKSKLQWAEQKKKYHLSSFFWASTDRLSSWLTIHSSWLTIHQEDDLICLCNPRLKLNRGFSVCEKQNKTKQTQQQNKNIYCQIISFDEWDTTKDSRLVTIQTIDKTMYKPGGVVSNYKLEMGHRVSKHAIQAYSQWYKKTLFYLLIATLKKWLDALSCTENNEPLYPLPYNFKDF